MSDADEAVEHSGMRVWRVFPPSDMEANPDGFMILEDQTGDIVGEGLCETAALLKADLHNRQLVKEYGTAILREKNDG